MTERLDVVADGGAPALGVLTGGGGRRVGRAVAGDAGALGAGQALGRADRADTAQDLRGVPPGRLADDLALLVVHVERVALGAERLAGDVEPDEHRGVLGGPFPAQQAGALVADVAADLEVVDAEAVLRVLVRVEREQAEQVGLVVDVVLVEHHVLEDEAVVLVQGADRFRSLTEGLQPLDPEVVVHVGSLSAGRSM